MEKGDKGEIIAVCSEGESPDSQIFPRAGRSPWYLILRGSEFVKALRNPYAEDRGAGFKVAGLLKKENVRIVVAGNFGDNMEKTLKDEGIKTIIRQGTVKDVLEELSGKDKRNI